MSPKPSLVVRPHISKRKPVQSVLDERAGVDRVDGKEDEPRDQPDGHECLGHHEEEPNKDIWVDSILVQYLFRIGWNTLISLPSYLDVQL